MKVFYYADKNLVEEIKECGIKLNSNCSREITVKGVVKKCILAYLNPADCYLFDDDNASILKIKAPSDSSYIAEGSLYDESDLTMYQMSLIPIEEYKLGTYRKPECLISCTLLPHQIEYFDRRRDEPILYDNSEHIYIERVVYHAQEECPYYNDFALSKYYDILAENGDYIKRDIGDYYIYIKKDNKDIVATKKWR